MNESGTTWAFVVGIDKYQSPEVPRLHGAVADAIAAVKWLQALKVPSDQILLHAAPSEEDKPALGDLGLPWAGATLPDIKGSLTRLWDVTGGSRLFVFLSGHAAYEPVAGRVFLTEEAGIHRDYTNLGLDKYLNFFLSMSFRRQFLFLDGCLNNPFDPMVRPNLIAGDPVTPPNYAPRKQNSMVACYAAGPEERALEVERSGGLHRGLFLEYLLQGLDPQKPREEAVLLDFKTGVRTLDLRELMEWVRHRVREEAARSQIEQVPCLVVKGAAEAENRLPIIQLTDPPNSTGRVQVEVQPPDGRQAVKQIRLYADDNAHPYWVWPVPRWTGEEIQFPVVAQVPRGLPFVASCWVPPGAPWKLLTEPDKRIEVPTNERVLFELQRQGETGAVAPEPLAPAAAEAPAAQVERAGASKGGAKKNKVEEPMELIHVRRTGVAGKLDYRQVAQVLARPVPKNGDELAGGVWIHPHKQGPDFTVRRSALGAGFGVANAWAEAIRSISPEAAEVSVESTAEMADIAPFGNLRLSLDGEPKGLAGWIASEDLVWVGLPGDTPYEPLWRGHQSPGTTCSPQSLCKGGSVLAEPGPARVLLDLPWGRWSETVRVPLNGSTEVKLPASVGRPPLRVPLWKECDRQETVLLGPAGEAPAGRLRLPGDGGSVALKGGPEGSAAWALRPATDPKAPGALFELDLGEGRRMLFPHLAGRPLGVDLAGGLRVEPLSSVPFPTWDLLMAKGRLDALEPAEAANLLAGHKDDWLLTLGVAYSILAAPQEFRGPFLHRVLKNLNALREAASCGPFLPDLDLLCAALAVSRDFTGGTALPEESKPGWFTDHAAGRLEPWARLNAVPVLRWGIPIVLRLLLWAGDEQPFADWRSALAGIEPRLSPASVWTTWTEEPMTAGG